MSTPLPAATPATNQTLPAPAVQLHGLLGRALQANRHGRLFHFITGPESPALALFGAAHKAQNTEGDWYGEHAGKWLVAAARAAAAQAASEPADTVLRSRVLAVAEYLLAQQEADGYLGTYALHRRFMQPQAPRLPTWDGAPSQRTWDIWVHSYLVLGLLEVHRLFGHAGCLRAACRIGDLVGRTLAGAADGSTPALRITDLGNHFGLSATVWLDAAMALHQATGSPAYLDQAELVLAQADTDPQLGLLRRALAGADAAEIGTGKAYQLCWNLVGLAKLHQATGEPTHRKVLDALWSSIHTHHLTPGGGPWGGVAHRSREVFNAPGSFSPQAYVETCSILAWLQFNREMLVLTGDARHAEAIETTAYNDLLGAMAPNGQDWCYYSFANGARVYTTPWRCCKSSGAMAIEELPALAYGRSADGQPRVQLYGPSQASWALAPDNTLMVQQRTDYPASGEVALHIGLAREQAFTLHLRIPGWAQGATVAVNGRPVPGTPPESGSFFALHRRWQTGDCVQLHLPMAPRLLHQTLRNVQESRAPDGSLVQQEVLHQRYVAVARGPLVYASGLVDGYKTEDTLRLPAAPCNTWISLHPVPDGSLAEPPADLLAGPDLCLQLPDRPPLRLEPAWRAGGQRHGDWRLTWFALAPKTGPVSTPGAAPS